MKINDLKIGTQLKLGFSLLLLGVLIPKLLSPIGQETTYRRARAGIGLIVIIIALPHAEPGLVSQPVYDEAFRVLLPKEHAWVKQKALEPVSLLDEPLLMLGAGNCFRDQVLDLCAQANPPGAPQILEGSSLETIRYMVASGIGITVLPASCADLIPKNDPLLRVRPARGSRRASRRPRARP